MKTTLQTVYEGKPLSFLTHDKTNSSIMKTESQYIDINSLIFNYTLFSVKFCFL